MKNIISVTNIKKQALLLTTLMLISTNNQAGEANLYNEMKNNVKPEIFELMSNANKAFFQEKLRVIKTADQKKVFFEAFDDEYEIVRGKRRLAVLNKAANKFGFNKDTTIPDFNFNEMIKQAYEIAIFDKAGEAKKQAQAAAEAKRQKEEEEKAAKDSSEKAKKASEDKTFKELVDAKASEATLKKAKQYADEYQDYYEFTAPKNMFNLDFVVKAIPDFDDFEPKLKIEILKKLQLTPAKYQKEIMTQPIQQVSHKTGKNK